MSTLRVESLHQDGGGPLAFARVDGGRWARTGVAEAIYAPGKRPREIALIAGALLAARREAGEEREWPVLATRVSEELYAAVEEAMAVRGSADAAPPYPARTRIGAPAVAVYDAEAQVLEFDPSPARTALGPAVVVSAGTTDRAVASEAAAILAAYGAEVARFDDVGVAGLHRLLDPDRMAGLARAKVIIAVAGMEGALPTVVAGLVKAPVIGLPTAIGYGVAEGGRAALHSMLATCAPGLTVVNIGNGFGAAAMAVKILRLARATE